MLRAKTLLTSVIVSSALVVPAIGFAGGNQAFDAEQKAQAEVSQGQSSYAGPLVGALKQSGKFTTFLKALEAADMTWVISKGGQHTVFAPTDEAFSKIPAKDMEALLKDKVKLQKVLSYHIAPNINYGWNERRDEVISMIGQSLKLQGKVGDASAKVNNADMTINMGTSNGVLYGISQVLWPQS